MREFLSATPEAPHPILEGFENTIVSWEHNFATFEKLSPKGLQKASSNLLRQIKMEEENWQRLLAIFNKESSTQEQVEADMLSFRVQILKEELQKILNHPAEEPQGIGE